MHTLYHFAEHIGGGTPHQIASASSTAIYILQKPTLRTSTTELHHQHQLHIMATQITIKQGLTTMYPLRDVASEYNDWAAASSTNRATQWHNGPRPTTHRIISLHSTCRGQPRFLDCLKSSGSIAQNHPSNLGSPTSQPPAVKR